jgi:hypothetical protein
VTQPNPQPPATHPVRQALADHGVTKVVIIDDAFDIPDLASFIAGEVREFLEALEDNQDARQELQALGIRIRETQPLRDADIQLLWERRGELRHLKPMCDALFAAKLSMLQQLQAFLTHLRDELGLAEVVLLGRNDEFTHLTAKVVFLDYYLGPGQTPASVRAASDYAKEVYRKYAGVAEKPFLVLTSSSTAVEQHKEEFRRATGFLGGMFDFVSKADLCTREKLLVKFDFWVMGFPIGHEIQRFVDTIGTSVADITKQFLDRVRELSLNDYAYIQMLSLQADGNPLGEYMLWLYQSLFGHLLFEANASLRAEMRVLDGRRFDDFLPTQAIPSEQLSEIYMLALFDTTVGELASHPHDSAADALEKRPYLQMGDVFIKDPASEIRMVINAQCDLAFSPEGGRPCDPLSSILLIAGSLVPLNKQVPKGNVMRTEFFKFEEQSYRIAWFLERVRSIPRAELSTRFQAEGYHRRARLRLPFALEVQQAFSANLTRVGLPVPPPIYQLVLVQTFGKRPDGSFTALHDPLPNAGFIAPYRGPKMVEERLVLTASYVDLLLGHCVALAEAFEVEAAKPATSNNDRSQFNQRAQLLRRGPDDFELRRTLLKPAKLPAAVGGNQPVAEKLLSVRWSGNDLIPASVRELIVIAIDPVLSPEPGTNVAPATGNQT